MLLACDACDLRACHQHNCVDGKLGTQLTQHDALQTSNLRIVTAQNSQGGASGLPGACAAQETVATVIYKLSPIYDIYIYNIYIYTYIYI